MTDGDLIEGDGIGPEIAAATVRAVEAAGGKLDVGARRCRRRRGRRSTRIRCRRRRSSRSRRTSSRSRGRSPRRAAAAIARSTSRCASSSTSTRTCGRCRRSPGVPSRYTNVDLVIVRENTEDLYAGVEHYVDPRRTAAESIAIITKFGSERVIVYAFEYARRHGPQEGHARPQGEHPEDVERPVPRHRPRGREALSRHRVRRHDRRRDRDEARHRARAVRRDRHDEPVRRHPLRPHRGPGRRARRRARRRTSATAAARSSRPCTAPRPTSRARASRTRRASCCRRRCCSTTSISGPAGERLRKGIHAALANAETRTGDLGGKANTAAYTDAVIRR